MGVKGDKSCEMSISNAPTALKHFEDAARAVKQEAAE
jgi:hypothetical protein